MNPLQNVQNLFNLTTSLSVQRNYMRQLVLSWSLYFYQIDFYGTLPNDSDWNKVGSRKSGANFVKLSVFKKIYNIIRLPVNKQFFQIDFKLDMTGCESKILLKERNLFFARKIGHICYGNMFIRLSFISIFYIHVSLQYLS